MGERKWKFTNLFNPFPSSVPIWHRLAKHSILILEGIIKKIPISVRLWVARRKELILGYMSRKTTKERIQAVTG